MLQKGDVQFDQRGLIVEPQIDREIFVVDDDPAITDVLSRAFSLAGYHVASFVDGASFVATARERRPSGVVLDLVLPGRSGLDVLDDIDAANFGVPIFLSSGHGDIPVAVEAIRRGAYDFLEKRHGLQAIVTRVSEAIDAQASGAPALPRTFPGKDLLTSRESEVLELVISGASSLETAERLGISRRTVEVHRARILAKLEAKNTAHLVRITMGGGAGAIHKWSRADA